MVIGVDNLDTPDQNPPLCISVTDTADNDWIKASAFTNRRGASEARDAVCTFYTNAKVTLSFGAITWSGMPHQVCVFIQGVAVESNGTSSAATNCTSSLHTSSMTSESSTASNMGVMGGFRILTAISDASNPNRHPLPVRHQHLSRLLKPSAGVGPRRMLLSQRQ